MKTSKKFVIIVALFFSIISAQEQKNWNGKKCAVVLTYDDALNVHLDNAVPLLDSLGFKGTFYVSGFYPGFRGRVNDWKSAALKGHELGNHTLFHPCEGKAPGREWVNPNYDLNSYTVQRMVDEIRMTNTLLQVIDGKTQRTFAYPCNDMKAGDSSYVNSIKKDFVAARGVHEATEKLNGIDLFNIGSFMINERPAAEMIALVKQAMEQNGLIVFLFHGVGGEHNLNVSLEAHRALLQFLKKNEKDIWIAPMVEIAEYIKAFQK